MTATTNQNRAVAEHCQEEGTPIIQIIMGSDGGKMMSYSLLQNSNDCHHFIPLIGRFDRVGFSLRLQNSLSRAPQHITADSYMKRPTVRWIEVSDVNRILIPTEKDFWEFSVYSATRHVSPDCIAIAVIENAPHHFRMSGAYVPESYAVHKDKYGATKHYFQFSAQFKLLSGGQWHVYDDAHTGVVQQ